MCIQLILRTCITCAPSLAFSYLQLQLFTATAMNWEQFLCFMKQSEAQLAGGYKTHRHSVFLTHHTCVKSLLANCSTYHLFYHICSANLSSQCCWQYIAISYLHQLELSAYTLAVDYLSDIHVLITSTPIFTTVYFGLYCQLFHE